MSIGPLFVERLVLARRPEAGGSSLQGEHNRKKGCWSSHLYSPRIVCKIRVNSVHPGPIDTEMIEIRTPEQNRQRVQLVPMKRMGTAEEVAALVLFLLSDESGYITGAEVAIDGGASL